MPSKASEQPYTGLFPFSRSKSFFTSSRTKSNQLVNITPPIQPSVSSAPNDAVSEDTTNSIQSTSTTNSRDSNSPPPIIIPTRTSSKASRSSSRHRYSQSISTTVDLASLRRSVSLRSVSSPQRHYRQPSTATLAASISHDNISTQHHHSKLHIPSFGKRHKSSENFRDGEILSPVESTRREPGMIGTVPYRNVPAGRPPTSHSTISGLNHSQASNGISAAAPSVPNVAPGAQNPHIIYQHILDTASKRISTLDYLRKAYVYFRCCQPFNLQLTISQPRRSRVLVQHPPLHEA